MYCLLRGKIKTQVKESEDLFCLDARKLCFVSICSSVLLKVGSECARLIRIDDDAPETRLGVSFVDVSMQGAELKPLGRLCTVKFTMFVDEGL